MMVVWISARALCSVARPFLYSASLRGSRAGRMSMVTGQRRRQSTWHEPPRTGTVYVYKGKGTADQPFRQIFTALQEGLCPESHQLQTISAQRIQTEEWIQDSTVAIVFAGGQTGGYVEALGEKGAEMIQHFVEAGRAYLGVCAGAYLACQQVLFDEGGKHEINEKRPLGFFKGVGVGPACQTFNPMTEEGAYDLRISFRKANGDVISAKTYVNGGGTFLPYSDQILDSRTVVLARFDDLWQKPAAAVQCHVGRRGGVAILSGSHLERPAMSTTKGVDDVRRECWRELLERCKLKTKSSTRLPLIRG